MNLEIYEYIFTMIWLIITMIAILNIDENHGDYDIYMYLLTGGITLIILIILCIVIF